MSGYLHSVDLLDCQGRATHRLTLDYDGTVTIHFADGRGLARVDPTARRNLTPAVAVNDQLLDEAAALRPG